ncbi:MAG: cytochrome c [Planctomycetota bacterium]|nr:cytochrome c [Planctomycetota bacterium]
MRRLFFCFSGAAFILAVAITLVSLAGCSSRPLGGPVSRGRVLYEVSCGACHQSDGEGKDGVASPLAGSEWVTGSPERLLRIALDGVRGPIMVKGRRYQLEMPALRHVYDDEDMAAILSYIRRAWGNSAPAIPAGFVGKVRAATSQRGDSWTAEELGSP